MRFVDGIPETSSAVRNRLYVLDSRLSVYSAGRVSVSSRSVANGDRLALSLGYSDAVSHRLPDVLEELPKR